MRQAHNRLLTKQTRTFRINENINFTNDDVMKYVIGALQWKLPRSPYPLIQLCPRPMIIFFGRWGRHCRYYLRHGSSHVMHTTALPLSISQHYCVTMAAISGICSKRATLAEMPRLMLQYQIWCFEIFCWYLIFMLQIWCWKRFSYCVHQFSYFSRLFAR